MNNNTKGWVFLGHVILVLAALALSGEVSAQPSASTPESTAARPGDRKLVRLPDGRRVSALKTVSDDEVFRSEGFEPPPHTAAPVKDGFRAIKLEDLNPPPMAQATTDAGAILSDTVLAGLLALIPAFLVLVIIRGRQPASRARTWAGVGMALGVWNFFVPVVSSLMLSLPLGPAVTKGGIGMLLWGAIFSVVGYLWGRHLDARRTLAAGGLATASPVAPPVLHSATVSPVSQSPAPSHQSPTPNPPAPCSETPFADPYQQAGEELLSGRMAPSAWARALVEGGGIEGPVKAAYVKLRVADLEQVAVQAG